jgi:predicted dehydrogenase
MKKYTVAQVGCGVRGKFHLDGWLCNPERFDVIALCDLDETKMKEVAAAQGISPALYTDAEKMLSDTSPDVFCFSTLPDVRLSLVELGARDSVKGMAFEKPMALSIAEAQRITRLCRDHGIKAVVSHQQKYLTSLQKVKELIDAGDICKVLQITADCQAWLAELGTHYMDYILWANGGSRAMWVVGHVHGKEWLAGSHPSPNNTMGHMAFENGVRANVAFGKLARPHMIPDKLSVDNRLTVYGTHGYVWGDTDGRWGAFTRRSGGEVIGGEGDGWRVQAKTRLQPLFAVDLADWLDDDGRPHPCNIEISYHGYEILEGLCISALDNRRVDLPLDISQCVDIFARMRKELPDCPDRP